MNTRRRDAGALALLSTSAMGSAVVAFAVQAVLARSLAPTDFGNFAAALAAVTVIAPAVGFGLPAYWLKVFGAEGWNGVRWMGASMRFITRSALLCLAIAVVWALCGARDAATGRLILSMLPVVLTQCAVEMASAKFQLEERFGLVAAWQGVQHITRLTLVLICWQLHARSEVVAIGFGLAGAAVSMGAWWSIAGLRKGTARLVGHGLKSVNHQVGADARVPSVGDIWRNTVPFGVANLLFNAYTQCGLLLVAHYVTAREAGSYSVVVTILSALYLFPTVLYQRLLMPRLFRWAASGDPKLRNAYQYGSRWMIVTGIAVAIIGVLIAPIAIPALFGRRYDSAVHIFMLMSVCAPLRFLTISASSVLTARSLNWVRNGCATAALVISVLSGCILVPVWGLVGAAAASIVGEVVWAILSVGSARRSLRRVPNAHVRDMADQKSLATHEASGSGNCAPISVVIPCFNCRTTIERAVDSVFNQTLRPTEIVLVDDHSTDGTGAFIQSLAQTYPSGWIRVILLENNVGPGAARNFGWATVRQPYIAFLDSDDSWHPRKIEIQYGWMHNHPDAAITGHPVAELSGEKSVCSIPLGELLEPCRVSRARVLFSNRFTPSSIVMRTNCSARFDEMKRHAEDYFMLLEILLVDAGRCYLFSVPLSYVYKAQFGAKTGLSAQLWMIQKGEQDNYHRFWKRGLISDVEWMCFSALSAVKYVRRCLMSGRFV